VRRGLALGALVLCTASLASLSSPRAAHAQPRPAASVRFTDARLEDVISALGQSLGLTVVTSDIPDKRVSLATPPGMRAGELNGVLESLLEAHGLVLVRRGNVVQVVPASQATTGGDVGVGYDFPDPPPVGIVTRLVPLQHLRPDEAMAAVKAIAGPTARVEPVARANALLVSDRGAYVARYLELLKRLDVASQAEDGLRTYVVPLKYASSDDLAAALGQLFGVAVGSPRRGSLDDASLSRNLDTFRARENDIFRQRQGLTPPAPTPAATTGAVAGTVNAGGRDSSRSGLAGQTTIVSNAPGNSLVIRTAPGNIGLLRETIDSLDRRPAQVLIEVTVAEVTLGRGLEYGVDWSAAAQRARTSGGASFGTPVVPDSNSLLQNPISDFLANVTRLGSVDVRAVLRALSSTSEVRVLSTPEVLATNNREARILVGSKFPFVASQRLNNDVAIDRGVQYQDIGTSLRIVPTINDQGYVSVQVLQEVSTITTQTVAAALNAPVINTREASTRAVVRDGQTVVIGGLIGSSNEVIESGVPFLKDIPVLGLPFKRQSRSRARTELAIFITPYIIRSDSDADAVRERARGRVGEVRPGDAGAARTPVPPVEPRRP
jgi:general secretion pathway protein D